MDRGRELAAGSPASKGVSTLGLAAAAGLATAGIGAAVYYYSSRKGKNEDGDQGANKNGRGDEIRKDQQKQQRKSLDQDKGEDQQKQQLKSLHQEKVQKQKKADRVDSKEEDKKTQQQFEDTEKDKQKVTNQQQQLNFSTSSWADIMDGEEEEQLERKTATAMASTTTNVTQDLGKLSLEENSGSSSASASKSSSPSKQRNPSHNNRDSGVASPVTLGGAASSKQMTQDQDSSKAQPQQQPQQKKSSSQTGAGGASVASPTKARSNSTDGGLGGSVCGEDGAQNGNADHNGSGSALSDSGQGSEPDEGGGARPDDGKETTYHFYIPNRLCGQLIGIGGANVRRIKEQSRCKVSLNPLPGTEAAKANALKPSSRNNRKNPLKYLQNEYCEVYEPQICSVTGTRSGIAKCIEMIRRHFSNEDFPELTLDQISVPSDISVLATRSPAESLLTGFVHDLKVATVASPGHLFVRLPSHPSFFAYCRLRVSMNQCYGSSSTSTTSTCPPLDKTSVAVGTVAVAPYSFAEETGAVSWLRVQILSFDAETGNCVVKFLDEGGWAEFSVDQLKQIRSDFLVLPFQAIECYLANVIPANGSADWSNDSIFVLDELLTDKLCSAEVVGFAEDCVPLLNIYVTESHAIVNTRRSGSSSSEPSTASGDDVPKPVLLNKELVSRGVAAWVDLEPVSGKSEADNNNESTTGDSLKTTNAQPQQQLIASS